MIVNFAERAQTTFGNWIRSPDPCWIRISTQSLLRCSTTKSRQAEGTATTTLTTKRRWFFATAYYASPCALWTQLCFSKSSCATRLKVSAATVLSRRGAVIPHVQWEQHQPLKSSPSIQIRCLFIYLPLRACWDWSPGCDGLDIKGVPPTMGNLPWNRRVAKYQRCLATTLTEGTFGGSGTGLDTPRVRSVRRLLGE
jgi:hypothetical protein